MCVCVRGRVRVRVRVCKCACGRVRVRACKCACGRVRVRACEQLRDKYSPGHCRKMYQIKSHMKGHLFKAGYHNMRHPH